MNEVPVTSIDKSKQKVLLLEGVHENASVALRAAGYTSIDCRLDTVPEDELASLLEDTYLLGIRSRTQITARSLASARRLAAIGAFCIGTNQVDLDAAAHAGIAVFNAPFSNTRSVAELVLAEAILLLRDVPRKNALAHRGVWAKSVGGAREIRGKTLGIVGYGNIGSQFSVLAEGLGMRVIYFDAITKLPIGNAHPVGSLAELLRLSDIVSLHVPETSATHQMIGAAELSAMRKGSALINASRGTVVDLDALADALTSGHLAGAAVDVYPAEPRSNDDPFESPLAGIDSALLTPHVGGSTVEAQANIGTEVAEKLVRYSDNGSTVSSVNFPEVSLPPHPNHHRLLHIHENVPGVLSSINAVFSEIGANVAAQHLQTRGEIGYVVLDVDTGSSDEALARILEVPGTIRARVLF